MRAATSFVLGLIYRIAPVESATQTDPPPIASPAGGPFAPGTKVPFGVAVPDLERPKHTKAHADTSR
jgi:hypothetical protein